MTEWPSVLDQEFVLLLWSGFRPFRERVIQQCISEPMPAIRLHPVRGKKLTLAEARQRALSIVTGDRR